MKFVLIVYSIAIEEEVMDAVESVGVYGFTRWVGVQGRGQASGTHEGSHIWPGTNNVLGLAVDDGVKDAVLDRIRSMKQRLSKEGIKAFVLPMEDIL